MTLEEANTIATFGTFVVITVTAIAATVQLRHMRSSNYINALNEMRETMEEPHFVDATQFVMSELTRALEDPELRYQVRNPLKRTAQYQPMIEKLIKVGNYFESMGTLIKADLAEKNMVLDMWGSNVVRN